METKGLPGAHLAEQGLADLARAQETVPSLLDTIGSPRLRLLGFKVPSELPDAERRLHRLLEKDGSDSAHDRCNALVRTLVSFERAANLTRRAA